MEDLEEAPLFVAATRPALIAGLPLGVAVSFIMLGGIIMILGQNPLYELVLLPLWVGARAILRYDYNAVRVLTLWLRSSAVSIDAHRWGGASPSPFPAKPAMTWRREGWTLARQPCAPRGIFNAS